MLLQDLDFEPGLFEHIDGSFRGFWHEVVIECVGPENDFLRAIAPVASLSKPGLESFGRECGDPPLLRYTRCQLRKTAQSGELGEKVDEAGSERGQPRPLIDPSKGVGGNGAHASLPVVGKEFGFVCGHVDVDGAVAFASLASEAKIECLLDVLVTPAVADDFAIHHLPEQVSAAAGGMHFLASDHVAGAHGVLMTAAILAATLADADAAQRGAREAALVIGIFEVGVGLPGLVVGAESQVFIDAIRLDNLAWVHL